MDAFERYDIWCKKELEDNDLTEELIAISGKKDEIYERFYTDLVFGTGGLRGILGAGSNRMNLYTVRRATQGICQWLKNHKKNCAAAISYDSRNKSQLFAKEVASVFAANGIKVYIFSALAPTPLLSWAVRYYKCDTGVMITASHNPAEYNGYKAYDENGCQITDKAAAEILGYIASIDMFSGVLTCEYEKAVEQGKIEYVSDKAVDEYFKNVLACRCNENAFEGSTLKIAYTPLNGTGNLFVRRILKEIGAKAPVLVKEQAEPDGNFPTCPYPNPEMRDTLALGIETAKAEHCDILIATDPDADRLGVAVNEDGDFILLNGNEVGVLMAEYIACSRTKAKTMPQNPVMVKTIVSTELADEVAKSYGIEVINVLTGFKYIGDQISLLEKKGEDKRFVFGFEESCGYLAGAYIREKDGIVASMLIAEMAAFYKKQGKTLADVMGDIYQKYGYYLNRVTSIMLPGADGMAVMKQIMDKLFAAPPKMLGSREVVRCCDYRAGVCRQNGAEEKIDLPSSPVLSLSMHNVGTVVVRPSGTEPKLKIYYMIKGSTSADALKICAELEADVNKMLNIHAYDKK